MCIRDRKGIECSYKAGVFHNDGIPFVAKAFADQIDALLGAGNDDEIVVFPHDAVPAAAHFLHHVPQGRIPLGDRILKGADGILSHNFSGNFFYRLTGEGRCV